MWILQITLKEIRGRWCSACLHQPASCCRSRDELSYLILQRVGHMKAWGIFGLTTYVPTVCLSLVLYIYLLLLSAAVGKSVWNDCSCPSVGQFTHPNKNPLILSLTYGIVVFLWYASTTTVWVRIGYLNPLVIWTPLV